MEIRKALPIRWNEDAFIDLEEIYNYIKSRSLQNADYVVERILELIESLGFFSEKYPLLKMPRKTNRNYRSVSLWSFKIVYEVTADEVRIIKIFNNSKNPNKLLKNLPL